MRQWSLVHLARTGALSALFVALTQSGCAGKPVPQAYEVSVSVHGDPGQPVADAKILFGNREIGKTDVHGQLSVTLQGTEGQTQAFQVLCPEGYRSPQQPIAVILRRVSESGKRPEYPARCEPLLRSVVVAVRAEKGPNLPVMYLGQEVARTDSAGAAHFMLKSAPQDTIEVSLDTSRNQQLRPHNPSVRFEVAQHDDLYLFQQTFTVPPKPKAPKIQRLTGIINLGKR